VKSLFTTLAVLALASLAFGQDKQESTKKVGMVWHYFDRAKKCNVEWDETFAIRNKAFVALAQKVQEGDKNKIRLYLSKAREAESNIGSAWACGSDYSRNLADTAGSALTNPGNLLEGKMTETEYDEAMALVKTLQKKIGGRPLTVDQRKIWNDAVLAIGAKPGDIFYKID
jgi:hypothetical protein